MTPRDSIYLTPYQEAICTSTSPVLLCKAGRLAGTTTGFANLCKEHTGKEDLIVLFCDSRHYKEYRKIIYPNSYTEEASPKNMAHRECMSDLGGILRNLQGCVFDRCVVVVDEVLICEDFEDFLVELHARTRATMKVRVKEDTLLVPYKGWYKKDGTYVDTFAGLDFNMISGSVMDVR
jgi:hypothetical protein